MAISRRPAPPAPEGVNFGDDSFYSGGFGLPEGRYAVEFSVQMFQPTKRDGSNAGNAFLAVVGLFTPLEGGDAIEHAMSMGGKAHLAFVPTPDGKGLLPIPGGSGSLSDQSNWNIFRKSMLDCGLPQGVLVNSFTTIDGIHVHTQNIPEPEGRKEMRARNATGETAEGAEGQPARDRRVTVVTEILDDGKPWEGTGGIPDGTAKPAVKTAAKPGPKGVVKPTVAVGKTAQDIAEEAGNEDIEQAALNGMASVIEANPNGCAKLKLRTGTFAAVKAAAGDDMAQAVGDTYFTDDKSLKALLEQLGYTLKGTQVVPQ